MWQGRPIHNTVEIRRLGKKYGVVLQQKPVPQTPLPAHTGGQAGCAPDGTVN